MSRCRIIPARAGFTIAGYFDGAKVKDHPRSRGVYGAKVNSEISAMGSSPLARGLQGVTVWANPNYRIIPARAGFTYVDRHLQHDYVDHPRSRGVYVCRRHPSRMSRGSSPLARGLPNEGAGEYSVARIIPARAGFTGFNDEFVEKNRDHPRSRGVYHPVGGIE